MARLKDMADKVSDLLHIAPSKIEIDPEYNVEGRELDTAHDEEDRLLKDSIRANGVLEPLMVRQNTAGDGFVVLRGHRRLSAVMELIEADGVEIKTVPCIPEGKYASDQDRQLDLLTSNTGKKALSELQMGTPMKRLLSYGWDEKQISERSGIPLTRVHQVLELSGADHEVREMVRKGEVKPGVAAKAVKKAGARAKDTLRKASAIAKASGAKRVTAKVVKEAEQEGIDPDSPRLNHRGKRQLSKHDLTKCLRSILDCDTIDEAKALVRHTLGVKKTSMDPEENAEILAEFGIGVINPAHQPSVDLLPNVASRIGGDW